MRHLLTIIRSNQLLPQGGLVSLFHSALWMKVGDTSWFCLAEENSPFPKVQLNEPSLEAPNVGPPST